MGKLVTVPVLKGAQKGGNKEIVEKSCATPLAERAYKR
jgi:hypothetical protein